MKNSIKNNGTIIIEDNTIKSTMENSIPCSDEQFANLLANSPTIAAYFNKNK